MKDPLPKHLPVVYGEHPIRRCCRPRHNKSRLSVWRTLTDYDCDRFATPASKSMDFWKWDRVTSPTSRWCRPISGWTRCMRRWAVDPYARIHFYVLLSADHIQHCPTAPPRHPRHPRLPQLVHLLRWKSRTSLTVAISFWEPVIQYTRFMLGY